MSLAYYSSIHLHKLLHNPPPNATLLIVWVYRYVADCRHKSSIRHSPPNPCTKLESRLRCEMRKLCELDWKEHKQMRLQVAQKEAVRVSLGRTQFTYL